VNGISDSLWVTYAVYQIDLESASPEEGIVKVAEWDGFLYDSPFAGLIPSNFFGMTNGPDCRIYIVSGFQIPYLHVIDKPDRGGAACRMLQHAVYLPHDVDSGLPSYPWYRYGTEYPLCDSSIQVILTDIEEIRREGSELLPISVYPNPADAYVQIRADENIGEPLDLDIYDMLGRLVHRRKSIAASYTLNTTTWASGMYTISLTGRHSGHKHISRIYVRH